MSVGAWVNHRWHGLGLGSEFSGALAATLVAVPQSITIGLLAVAPLGSAYAYLGVLAGLYASFIASFITGLPGRATCQVSGPHSALSVIVASIIAGMMSNPQFSGPEGPEVARILGMMFLCLFMAGLFQALLGVLRFGSFIKYIPFPVVAGFMNGIAISIFVKQIHPLLGVPSSLGWFDGADLWWEAFKPVGLLIGLATLWIMREAPRAAKAIPAGLVGLLAGTAMYFLARALLGESAVGSTIGDIPARLLGPGQLVTFMKLDWDREILDAAITLVPSAMLIAVISSIVTLMSSVSVASLTNTRPDNNSQLTMQGLSNMAIAVCSVVPSAGAGSRSIANYKAGGRTRISTLIHAMLLFSVAISLAFVPWAAYIPSLVMAALLVNTAFSVVDGWSREIIQKLRGTLHRKSRQDLLINLSVVVLVALVMTIFNMTVAVAIGVLATVFLFIGKMSQSIVRRSYDGEGRHSMRMRDPTRRDYLLQEKARLRVIELEGAVFFGTADQLSIEVEALAADARIVLIDFQHVIEFDATGARILVQISAALKKNGKILIFSHIQPSDDGWRFLVDMGVNKAVPEEMWFQSLDFALEWAEEEILRSGALGEQALQEIPLGAVSLAAGLDEYNLAALARKMQRQQFRKGDVLFNQGSVESCIYVLVRGTVSIQLTLDHENSVIRFSTFGPGIMFGEMALLDNKPRSADAVAKDDVVVYCLTQAAFDNLREEFPEVALTLLLNMSLELASRVRIMSTELRIATMG